MIPKSLFFRLMGAFALVIVVSVASVYLIANQTTTNEFRLFMFRGQMVATQDLANQLADYYRTQGSLRAIDGERPEDEVYASIIRQLG